MTQSINIGESGRDNDFEIHGSVRFENKSQQMKLWLRNRVGAIMMATGLGLSGSSILYTGHNDLTNTDGDGIMPAKTLFTHLKGLEKIDHYENNGKYWEYMGSEVKKDGKDVSFLDEIIGFPGNGMIFIGGILLVGIGINMSAEKKQAFLLQVKNALISGEKITLNNTRFNITISLKGLNHRQTQVNINGTTIDGTVINLTEVENTPIEKSADKCIQKIISKVDTIG